MVGLTVQTVGATANVHVLRLVGVEELFVLVGVDLVLQVVWLAQNFRVFFVFIFEEVVDHVAFIRPLGFVVENGRILDGRLLEFCELVDGFGFVVAFHIVDVLLLLLQRHANLAVGVSWHSLRNFWVVVLPRHMIVKLILLLVKFIIIKGGLVAWNELT